MARKINLATLMGLLAQGFIIALAQSTPRDFLKYHNAARETVGVSLLKWDPKLEAYAKSYAKTRSKDCELVHSHGEYGENLYWGLEESMGDAKDAVEAWVEEKEFYDRETNTCSKGEYECGHYTQVVWRDTESVGCATVKCHDESIFISCNYFPPGNIDGQKPY